MLLHFRPNSTMFLSSSASEDDIYLPNLSQNLQSTCIKCRPPNGSRNKNSMVYDAIRCQCSDGYTNDNKNLYRNDSYSTEKGQWKPFANCAYVERYQRDQLS